MTSTISKETLRISFKLKHARYIMYQKFSNSSHVCSIAKKDLSEPMKQTADPKVEEGWYEWWEANNFFRRKSDLNKFVMILPPPNVTGQLHMGHALTIAIQDALVRWNQMHGREVVWIPGCDHAGIATQVVVERNLLERLKISRHDMGKEEFLKHVEQWKAEHGNAIFYQIRRLGAAIDWDRSVFTMDEGMNQAVSAAFIKLFDTGLIYKGNYMVNWCCTLQSAISDSEVEHENLIKPTLLNVPGYKAPIEFGKMYDILYQIKDSSEKVTVSTTRPETMFGDVALMVHPSDERYLHLHGCLALHPLTDKPIPIVTSELVSKDKESGVVKVTPGHSASDYKVGVENNLPIINILDDSGRLRGFSEVEGMPRFDAREWVLKYIGEKGLYKGSRPHAMAVPRCSRTGDIIEHRIKPQWFLRLEELSERASLAVEKGELRLYPTNYERVWKHFLSDRRDWCISRQIWYGHRIPIYWASIKKSAAPICSEETESGVYVAAYSEDEARLKAAEKLRVDHSRIQFLKQEEDVLDTWFSSALIPFSVFGWPKKTEDFNKYYPTSLLETGHDILYYWVARMIMLGLQLTGTLPFKEVLLHGLVCDAHGHKMSKSKGNVLNPMDIIAGVKKKNGSSERDRIYGADALRFSLCSYDIKNSLIACDQRIFETNYRLKNKIWQSFKFLLLNCEKIPDSDRCMGPVWKEGDSASKHLHIMDRWILSCLAEMVLNVNKGFQNYDFHVSTNAFKKFWLTQFCDVYMETTKQRLWNYENDLSSAHLALSILWTCFHTSLLSVSPFMPFLTEELYQRLPSKRHPKCDSIMQCQFPRDQDWVELKDESVEDLVDLVVRISSSFRNIKMSYNINKSFTGSGKVFFENDELRRSLTNLSAEIQRLASLAGVSLLSKNDLEEAANPNNILHPIKNGVIICFSIKELINPELELKRLNEKLKKLAKKKENLLKRVPTKLKQEAYDKDVNDVSEQIDNLTPIIENIQKMCAS